MKKLYNVIATCLVLSLVGVGLMSAFPNTTGIKYSSGPAHTGVDKTGGPISSGSCSQCHGSVSSATTTVITVREASTNNIVTQYTGGTLYKINVQVSNPSYSKFGLQLVALRMPFNQNAGNFGSFLTANTQTSSFQARAYLEHDGASSTGSFEIFWTAPPAFSGNVTFYYNANAVNGTGSTAGDAPGAASSLVLPELQPTTVTYAASYCTNEANPTPVVTGTTNGTFSANSSDITVNASTGEIDLTASLPGTYDITYTYSGGTKVSTVIINQSYEIDLNEELCFGDSSFLDGAWQTASGIYTDAYTAVNGCDSIINTTLTILPNNVTVVDTVICQGDSVMVDGVYYKDPGTYSEVFAAANGCDSTMSYNLSIEDYATTLQVDASTITITNTTATSFEFFDCGNGTTYDNGGSMVFNVPNNGTFAVRLFGPSCTYETACEPFTTIGLEENTLDVVDVYPNPFTDEVIFENFIKDEAVTLSVYNAQGRLIMKTSENVQNGRMMVDLGGLNAGVYFVQVKGSDYQFVKRLLKD